MIGKEFFKTRKDGVNLYRTIDAKVDSKGEFIKDENDKLIPTGYQIKQVETGVIYSEAIDVENAPYTYSETDIPIETIETIEENKETE